MAQSRAFVGIGFRKEQQLLAGPSPHLTRAQQHVPDRQLILASAAAVHALDAVKPATAASPTTCSSRATLPRLLAAACSLATMGALAWPASASGSSAGAAGPAGCPTVLHRVLSAVRGRLLPQRFIIIIKLQASKLHPAAWPLPVHASAGLTQAPALPLPVRQATLLLQHCCLRASPGMQVRPPCDLLLQVRSSFILLLWLWRWWLQRCMLLRHGFGWHWGSTAAQEWTAGVRGLAMPGHILHA